MEKTVKQRVQAVLQKFGSNPTQLAKMYNLNQKTVHNQINDNTQLSVSIILLILKTYPDISAEWLLRGTGSMIVSEKTEFADKLSDDAGSYSTIRELQDRIVALEAENNVLREMVGLQKNKQREGKSA